MVACDGWCHAREHKFAPVRAQRAKLKGPNGAKRDSPGWSGASAASQIQEPQRGEM